jgi:hypothetical protein
MQSGIEKIGQKKCNEDRHEDGPEPSYEVEKGDDEGKQNKIPHHTDLPKMRTIDFFHELLLSGIGTCCVREAKTCPKFTGMPAGGDEEKWLTVILSPSRISVGAWAELS